MNNYTGRVVNRDYRITAQANGMVIDRLRGDDLSVFPIEHARLRTSKFAIAICAPLIAVYGWVLQLKTVWESNPDPSETKLRELTRFS